MKNKIFDDENKVFGRRKYMKLFGSAVGAIAGLNASTRSSVAQSGEWIFSGVANTVILAGDGITVTQHNYQRNVIIVLGAPKQGGLAETNPFNLFIGPADRNETALAGHFEIHSAALVDNNLFQYWEIQMQDSNTFVGTLTNPFNAEAIAWNLINVDLPLVPGNPNLGVLTSFKAMGAGTQLSGGVDETAVNIRLLGATIDQFTQFGSEISATRIA